MRVIKETGFEEGKVAYMADELGLHKIWNPGEEVAVSLHCKFLKSFRTDLCLRSVMNLNYS